MTKPTARDIHARGHEGQRLGFEPNRASLVLVGIAVFLLTVWFCTPDWAILVFLGMAEDVPMVAVWVAAAALLGWTILPRRSVLGAPWSLKLTTAAALGLGCYSLAALLLGLTGWLNRWTALAMPLCSVLVWFFVHGRDARATGMDCGRDARAIGLDHGRAVRAWFTAPARWQWLWLLAVPFLGLTLTATSVLPGHLWKPYDPHPYDVMEYHLQVPREWYESGRITPLLHNVYCFFPANQEMQYLLAMHIRGGAWAAKYSAQHISAAYMLLAIMGAYAATKQLTKRPESPILAAVAMAAVPWIPMLGSVAYVESSMLMYATLAMAWVFRATLAAEDNTSSGESPLSCFIIAGALAGLACGAKYTAVPAILLGLPVCLLLARLLTRGQSAGSPIVRGVGAFVLAGALVFSPWLIRNAAWTGNPVFPLEMRLLGRGHFDDIQVTRFEKAHRVREEDSSLGARLSLAGKRLMDARDGWQFGFILIPAAMLTLVIVARRQIAAFLLLLLLAQLIFWIDFTHIMPRFVTMIIPIAAVTVALYPPRWLSMAIVIAAGAVGFSLVFTTLSAELSGTYGAFVRLGDYSVLLPELKQATGPQTKLALIGDCQPFFFGLPTNNLRYRTVLDLKVDPTRPPWDTWLDKPLSELQKDHVVIVNPAELRRLAETYYAVPQLPPDWRQKLQAAYGSTQPLTAPRTPDDAVAYPPIAR